MLAFKNILIPSVASAFAFTVAVKATAQIMPAGNMMPAPMFACATSSGLHPMPNAIPQPGRPCGNGVDNGVTVVISGPGAPNVPNGPFGGMPQFPNTPQGIAGAFGINHEGQVTAACVANYGVSYAAAGCVAGQLTADELQKCFSDGVGGRGCFGDNNTLVSMIRSNFEAARRENGTVDQTIRVVTGISPKDIRDHGILGGNNSVFHCPFGGC